MHKELYGNWILEGLIKVHCDGAWIWTDKAKAFLSTMERRTLSNALYKQHDLNLKYVLPDLLDKGFDKNLRFNCSINLEQ